MRTYRRKRSSTSSASASASGEEYVALAKPAEGEEELPRRLDAERHVLDEQALVRGVDVPLGQVEAGDDRRDSAVGERRHFFKRADIGVLRSGLLRVAG